MQDIPFKDKNLTSLKIFKDLFDYYCIMQTKELESMYSVDGNAISTDIGAGPSVSTMPHNSIFSGNGISRDDHSLINAKAVKN